MNKKLIYAAMALPMLFTACSQDELFEEANGGMDTPKVKGYKVDLVTDRFDGNEITRATWGTNNLTWDPADKISVYWLGLENTNTATAALDGWFNSVYNTEDGNKFTSQSLIYQGGNVAVFPADLYHTTKQGIKISVPAIQGADEVDKTPFISNRLNVAEDEHNIGVQNNPGYRKELYAPLKQAANVVTFQFTLKNTEELLANTDYNFKVESVSLVANKNAFAESATIKGSDREVENGTEVKNVTMPAAAGKATHKVWNSETKKNDLDCDHFAVDQVLAVSATAEKEELKSTSVVTLDEEKGLYKATFVVLPTDVTTFDETSEIVIETTCGRINLKTSETQIDEDGRKTTKNVSKLSKPESGKETTFDEPEEVLGAVTNVNTNEVFAVAEMIQKVVSYRRNESQTSNFLGEKVGRTYILSFEADMSNATLNNSKVYNSADILRYISIYKAMKSTEKMNLVLYNDAERSAEFDFLTADAVKEVHGCNIYGSDAQSSKINVTLSLGDSKKTISVVNIENGGDFSAYINERNSGSYGSMWAENSKFTLKLKNADTAWEMNDCWTHNNVSAINNHGTLTVKGTDGDSKKHSGCVLTTSITNNGTLKIGGNGILVENNKLNNKNIVEIAAGQEMIYNVNNSTIEGTTNVAERAFLTAKENLIVKNSGTINNSGTVSSNAGNGGIVNDGIINQKSAYAITYLAENNNTINLMNRGDEVAVEGKQGKIVYNYTASDEDEFEHLVEDKFTYVKFNDVRTITLSADYEIPLTDLSFEINNTVTLRSNSNEIADLVVNSGKVLNFLTAGSGYDNILYVRDLKNNGRITLGGTIYYSGYSTTVGTLNTRGTGSVKKKAKVVGTLDELQAALAGGHNVTLSAPIEITEDEEINLNGSTISSSSDVFVVTAGHLVIEGNGTVAASVDNSSSACAVWAKENGKVTIKGGTYKCGDDTSNGKTGNWRNDCIYAKDDATIVIEGGEFMYTGENPEGHRFLLNVKDDAYEAGTATIIVKGGRFYNFNPGDNAAEGANTSFLAEGYKYVVENGELYVVSKE